MRNDIELQKTSFLSATKLQQEKNILTNEKTYPNNKELKKRNVTVCSVLLTL